MAYITYDQYTALFGPTPITEVDFPIYAGLASDLIDQITRYSIDALGGFSQLPGQIQTLVEKATGAQVLYFSQLGLESVLSGEAGAEFTVGKVHVGGTNANQSKSQMMISPLASTYLEQSGLMGRDVMCLGPFRRGFYGIW